MQGCEVSDADIELIRELLAAYSVLGRTPLSVDLCTRNDRAHRIQAPIKDVYLYARIPDFRGQLGVADTNKGRAGE